MNATATKLRKASRVALKMGALTPFFLSLILHAVGPTAQSMTRGANKPSLAFEQYLIDMGRVSPTGQVQASFSFINTASRDVQINNVTASCGCLEPRLSKKLIEPNETGEILLRVNTANQQPGAKAYYVTVEYDDGRPHQTELIFKVDLPKRGVIVRPRSLVVFQLSDRETIQEFVVTDFRAHPLDVEGVSSNSKLVSVELGRTDVEEGHRTFYFQATIAGDVPPGQHSVLITIITNDPEFPELRVPLRIDGRAQLATDSSKTEMRETSKQ